MANHKIAALVGMCGSGKSVVCDMFVKKGWNRIYFGQVTMDELKARGLEKNEQNERSVREELRRNHGPAAFAKLLLPSIEKAAEEYITSGADALVSRMLKDEKCDIFRMTQMFYRKYPSEYKNADDYINNFISESEVNISAEVKVGRIGQMTITR